MNSRLHRAALFGCSALLSSSAIALPTLSNNQFFGDPSLVSSTNWAYTGTLPSGFDAGFRAQNVDDDFFGDSGTQYSNGRRSMGTSTGLSPAYTLRFGGSFERQRSEAWRTDLLSQSKGTRQVDIEHVRFPSPGANVTNEHPIPSGWQGLTGYGVQGLSAQFEKTMSVARKELEPGRLGCPAFVSPGGARTGHCAFTGAYFRGGASLSAALQGQGSVENFFPVLSDKSVTIDAKSNRTTNFIVNGAPVYSGTVNGSATSFKLVKDKINAVDLKFNFDFKNLKASVGANLQWDGAGNTASFDASYVRRTEMPDFQDVGRAEKYVVKVRDEPQLSAGITGTNFDHASVLASAGLSGLDATILPVFQPLASGRLVVKDASPFKLKSPYLPIPSRGFTSDLPITLHFLLANEGAMKLQIDRFKFSMIDDDFLFFPDDLLATVTRDLDFALMPDTTLDLAIGLILPRDKLNAAVDFLEGSTLELAGTGTFTFHDTFGTRTVDFNLAVPEPGTLALALLALGAALRMPSKRRHCASGD